MFKSIIANYLILISLLVNVFIKLKQLSIVIVNYLTDFNLMLVIYMFYE